MGGVERPGWLAQGEQGADQRGRLAAGRGLGKGQGAIEGH